MIQVKRLARCKSQKSLCRQSFGRYALRTYCVPGTIQDTGNLTVKRKDSSNCFHIS